MEDSFPQATQKSHHPSSHHKIFIYIKSFTEFDCPFVAVLGVCSNQGTCDESTGTCICDEGFHGQVCLGNAF